MLILGQKPYYSGPTVFKIPQPSWHTTEHYTQIVTSLASIYMRHEHFILESRRDPSDRI